jgi:hypothetical protein
MSDTTPSTVVPLPSSVAQTPRRTRARVVAHEKTIAPLLKELVKDSGLPLSVVADRLGVRRQTVEQYCEKRMLRKPSLIWFAKLAEVCGASIVVEFPAKPLV